MRIPGVQAFAPKSGLSRPERTPCIMDETGAIVGGHQASIVQPKQGCHARPVLLELFVADELHLGPRAVDVAQVVEL